MFMYLVLYMNADALTLLQLKKFLTLKGFQILKFERQ